MRMLQCTLAVVPDREQRAGDGICDPALSPSSETELCSWVTAVLGGWCVTVQWVAENCVLLVLRKGVFLLEENDVLSKNRL